MIFKIKLDWSSTVTKNTFKINALIILYEHNYLLY